MTNSTVGKPRKSVALESALIIAIATPFYCPPQYQNDLAEIAAYRIPAITSCRGMKAELDSKVFQIAAQEMIANLRNGGMPISAIADVMRVERKTIYAWLSGGEVRKPNLQRTEQVHGLLTGVSGVDSRGVYRFWNTKVDDNKTLRDLMTADNIDESAVRSVLDNLRPAALRAMASERKMSRQGPTNAILDEIPEVGVNG